jgi:predicted transporter
MSDFLSGLSSLLQIVLAVLALIVGFYLARRWRIRRLRAKARGHIPLTQEI